MVHRIVEFIRPLFADFGYPLVFLATFLEDSVAAGLVVPGETIVILAGFYARVGGLSLPWVMLAALLGAVLGDNVGYLIGRRLGGRLSSLRGAKHLFTRERLVKAEDYYGRHGGKTVFFGRFVPVVRSLGCLVAGASRMRWRPFIAYDLIGATIWVAGHTLLGFLVGASYEKWKGKLTLAGVGVLGLLILLVLGSRWAAGRRRGEDDADLRAS